MRLRLGVVGLVWAMVVVAASSVFAQLGVGDTGRAGTAIVRVGDLLERVVVGGGIGDQSCSMPSDNSAYGVSESARKVRFTIGWRFINQMAVRSQRFTTGYRVYKDDGSGGWMLLSQSDRRVDQTLGPNSQRAGEGATSDLALSGTTRFKVMVLYDIYGVKATSQTRIISIDPSIPD